MANDDTPILSNIESVIRWEYIVAAFLIGAALVVAAAMVLAKTEDHDGA